MNPVPLDQLSLEKLSALVQTKFRVHLDAARQVEFDLVEATACRGNPDDGAAAGGLRQESFSLLFQGPPTPLLPQQTYRFEHDQIGEFDLFIVPVGRDAVAIQYQVVFNRLRQPA